MPLKINLRDEENNADYDIEVDEHQYKEIVVNGNLELATQLLNKQLEKENFIAAFNMLHDNPPQKPVATPKPALPHVAYDDNSSFSTTTLPGNTELDTSLVMNNALNNASSPSGPDSSVAKLWTDDTTTELINLCKKYENDFENGVKRYVWAKIAQELTNKFQCEFSIQQCDTKWKGLRNTYKIVKKHNDQSGNSRKEWRFFDLMNDVLFARPEIQAPATCSSLSGLVLRNLNNTDEGVSANNSTETQTERIIEDTNPPTNSTPTSSQFQSSFMRKRKAAENAVERRHREKMTRQDRFLDLLERLTNTVDRSSTSAANSEEQS